jgi:hypothetical protein
MKSEISEASILALLEKKFEAPRYAFFTQVKSEVGYGDSIADAFAVAMWRSLGLEIIGFEVKVSRADWLRELKHPEKSDKLFGYCDRWWLVLSDKAILGSEELPPMWGLMVVNGRKLKVVYPAVKLEPVPLTKVFVASLLRRAFQEKLHSKRSRDYVRGYEDGRASPAANDRSFEQQFLRLEKAVAEFEKASGVAITNWNAGDIGEAVRRVRSGSDLQERIKNDLKYLLAQSRNIALQIEKELRVDGKPKESA